MDTHTFETHCFLCGAPARARETDHGTRRQFWCTNAKCGEYEISHTAMGRLDTSPDFKVHASQTASQVRDRDKIYEITFDPKAGCVDGAIVARRDELRPRVSDTWERGSPYERYVGRWSRQVAPEFLAWLAIPAGRRWLDVGCGTGALSAAIVDRCAPATVTGVEPSEGFLKSARESLAGRVTLHPGSATAIPMGDASVDVAVSGLVLNFVADPRAALLEMARVTGKGGTIAAYVWDYAGKMELMRHFWDAAVALDPGAAKLDEGVRFPICRPEALKTLFANAGLAEIEVKAIDIPTQFSDFDDYWQPFLGGQGPAPAYAMSLDETARTRLRDGIKERLPTAANGTISLTARAWAARASR